MDPGNALANLQKNFEYGNSKSMEGNHRNGIVINASTKFDNAKFTIKTLRFVRIFFLRITANITLKKELLKQYSAYNTITN